MAARRRRTVTPVLQLHCPVDHATTDPPAEVTLAADWAAANVIEGLLAEGRRPAGPAGLDEGPGYSA